MGRGMIETSEHGRGVLMGYRKEGGGKISFSSRISLYRATKRKSKVVRAR